MAAAGRGDRAVLLGGGILDRELELLVRLGAHDVEEAERNR
jgi:hypothetical protein